jgi:hypothetical protein
VSGTAGARTSGGRAGGLGRVRGAAGKVDGVTISGGTGTSVVGAVVIVDGSSGGRGVRRASANAKSTSSVSARNPALTHTAILPRIHGRRAGRSTRGSG